MGQNSLLVPAQNAMDPSGLTDSSSDGCSFSTGADAPGGGQWDEAPLPAHGYVEGQPWDVSGIPTDYSLKVDYLAVHVSLHSLVRCGATGCACSGSTRLSNAFCNS